jgi:predicted nucleotidyltransferase
MIHPNLSPNDYRQVKTALNDLQNQLTLQLGNNAPRILIYGSYARRQAHADSDVDVLLLYPVEIKPGSEIRRIGSILAELNLKYQVLISVLPVSESAYTQAEGALWENIRREGKPVHEF